MNSRRKSSIPLLIAILSLIGLGACEGESGEALEERPATGERTSVEEAVRSDVEAFFTNLGHSSLETISSFHREHVNQYDSARFADWVVEAVELDSPRITGEPTIEGVGTEQRARVPIAYRSADGEAATGELVLAPEGERWKLIHPPFGWERQ
ncbi:MAG: hypothetical protein GF399_10590 [Candidatus Coatesbacteria bacterium]|nr:hypothetical protein [Candidatus Coatesbacteria bacterium]